MSMMYFLSSRFVSWMDATSIPISEVSDFKENSADRLPMEISFIWSFTVRTGRMTMILVTIMFSSCMMPTMARAKNMLKRMESSSCSRVCSCSSVRLSRLSRNCSFSSLILAMELL